MRLLSSSDRQCADRGADARRYCFTGSPRRVWWAIATPMLLCAGGQAYSADSPLWLADTASLFCRDSTGVYQPFVRTNFARLKQEFIRQFGWRSMLRATSSSLGLLQFSQNGQSGDPETITYDIEPHDGGMSLLHMHVRLRGVTEDLSGNKMCWRTFAIVNAQ